RGPGVQAQNSAGLSFGGAPRPVQWPFARRPPRITLLLDEVHCVLTGGGVVTDETWPRVAVLGAGAVGCYFGGMLARAGAPVTLIGRPHHVEALARDGLWLDTLHFQERVPVT